MMPPTKSARQVYSPTHRHEEYCDCGECDYFGYPLGTASPIPINEEETTKVSERGKNATENSKTPRSRLLQRLLRDLLHEAYYECKIMKEEIQSVKGVRAKAAMAKLMVSLAFYDLREKIRARA